MATDNATASLFDFVEICGLVKASEHNGKIGRVFAARSDGRLAVTVQLKDGDGFSAACGLYLKPDNLRKLPDYYSSVPTTRSVARQVQASQAANRSFSFLDDLVQ